MAASDQNNFDDDEQIKGHSLANKWDGALRGPLGRIRTTPPAKFREGNRASGYPTITLNSPAQNKLAEFPENMFFTTKYTLWSFIPKILFEQFRKATSIYFLLICIITLIPYVSPVTPYTSILGLLFILAVSAIREAYEDLQRLRADVKVNNEEFTTLEVGTGRKVTTLSHQIQVGSLLFVQNGERIPVDMIVLCTSNSNSLAYMQTASLDGETNLKAIRAPNATQGKTFPELASLNGSLAAEAPHHHLYSFKGSLKLVGEKEDVPLDEKQLMLMGAYLKNTAWVVGICVYAGPETKMSLNQKKPPSKFSQLDRKLNKYVILVFALNMACCLAMAIANYYFETNPAASSQRLVPARGTTAENFLQSFANFVSYFALLNYLIPLSLVVTLDLVRFMQAQFISWDIKMTLGEKHCVAKTSNLNDELALVAYVFSDKTGTITENIMEFKKASVNGITYDDFHETKGGLREVIETRMADEVHIQEMRNYCLLMGLCHSVQTDVDEKTLNITYKAASPDEEALCKAAKKNGFVFKGRHGNYLIIEVLGEEIRYELLLELEFSSDRRRMSVVIKCPDGTIKMYCKGADTMISSLLDKELNHNKRIIGLTYNDIERFSQRGLRTLLLAEKNIAPEVWEEFRKRWITAANLLDGREKALAELSDELERGFRLIGATAIEDRLQDGVPQAIASMRKAGIKVWVITGDKQDTAVNIGYSSRLLTPEMKVLKINASSEDECGRILQELLERYVRVENAADTRVAAVVDGQTLRYVLESYREPFLELARVCVSVICNRVTPLQKAEVVKLVAEGEDTVTLAIGDGGNDVSMIQQAHIGVGIQGREGTQAARASDFSIPQFKDVQRLLTVHGRYCLLRNTKVIYYSFYKNIAVFMPQIWFSIFSGFSAQTLYDDWIMTFYNIVLTSAPIFFLGLFEKDLSEQVIQKHPQVYRYHKQLKVTSLIRWIIYAIYHSLVFFFVSYGIFYDDDVMLQGRTAGLRVFGAFVMSIGITVVSLKLALETVYWVVFSHISVWGSLLAYTAARAALSNMLVLVPDQYGVFWALFQIPIYIPSIVLVIVASLVPDFTFKYIKRTNLPKSWYILQEKDRKLPADIEASETSPLISDYRDPSRPTSVDIDESTAALVNSRGGVPHSDSDLPRRKHVKNMSTYGTADHDFGQPQQSPLM